MFRLRLAGAKEYWGFVPPMERIHEPLISEGIFSIRLLAVEWFRTWMAGGASFVMMIVLLPKVFRPYLDVGEQNDSVGTTVIDGKCFLRIHSFSFLRQPNENVSDE